MQDDKSELRALLDKQSINETLMRFCRGIDRCDLELLKTVFREDCIVDYGKVGGSAWEFFDTVLTARQEIHRTHHQISSVLIDLDLDTAKVESYVSVYHYANEKNQDMDLIVGGRYLDNFEKRKSEWSIVKRIFIMDWNQNLPATARWEEGLHAQFTHYGKHYPNDLLYTKLYKHKIESKE